MGALAKSKWTHGPDYPQGKTFGEILEWHLLYWGTGKPGNDHKKKGKKWTLVHFARAIHEDKKSNAETDESYAQKIRFWRCDEHLPENEDILGDILKALFHGKAELKPWKDDLKRAWHEGRAAKQVASGADSAGFPATASADAHATLPEDVQFIRGTVHHVVDTQTEHSEMLRFLVAAEMARRGDRLTKSGVTDEAVVRLAKRISDHVESPEHALAELGAALDELLQLRVDAKRGNNLDADVEAVLRRIDERAREGKFEEADSEAESAFRDWERREADRREREATIGMLFAEENMRTKRFLRDAEGVAFWIAKNEAIKAGVDVVGYVQLHDEIEKYISSGRDYGISIDLEISVALSNIAQSNAINVQEWAASQIDLGNALRLLGEVREETASLDAAVTAYRSALEVYTHADLPLDWAMAQNNLGNALATLGERQEGVASLDAAVAAYLSALEVYTHADLPLQWAAIQNNLGNTLRILGERQERTASLDAAVAAYRSALEVRTRTDLPLQWAMTQNNLGNALQTLGLRQEGVASLDAAVTAYRSALEVYTRADLPLQWAMTQNNLGSALRTLGERQEGTASLDAAVAAFLSALEVYTRADLPLDWALTQNSLGNALQTLGLRQEGVASLDAAVTAYRSALEVYTRADLPLQWAMTQNNLGSALQTLGERQQGPASLNAAVAAYRSALEVCTRADLPLHWAAAQNNLGNALQALGEWQEGTASLDAAAAAYRSALEIYTRTDLPLQWAMTQNNLGSALRTLGERQEGTASLDAAVAAYRSALEVYTRADLPLLSANTQKNLERALALRALQAR